MAHQVLQQLVRTGKISSDGFAEYEFGAGWNERSGIAEINGLLAKVIQARKAGKKGVFVHANQVEEAAIVNDIDVLPISSVEDIVAFFQDKSTIQPTYRDTREIFADAQNFPPNNMADIIEDENAKHALEIAAIGNHHCVLYGDIRSGRDRLAEHLPATLRRMSLQEALEVTLRFSELGKLASGSGLLAHRPYQKIGPFTSFEAAKDLIYLSHRGVLHLQDMGEISEEILRLVARVLGSGKLERNGKMFASSPLVLATQSHPHVPDFLQAFIDIYIDIPIIEAEDHLRFEEELESSLEIRERVEDAWKVQESRYQETKKISVNSEIPLDEVGDWVKLDKQTQLLLSISMKKQGIEAKFRPQILRVSRSIADRVGEEQPLLYHVAEAVQYMSFEEK